MNKQKIFFLFLFLMVFVQTIMVFSQVGQSLEGTVRGIVFLDK